MPRKLKLWIEQCNIFVYKALTPLQIGMDNGWITMKLRIFLYLIPNISPSELYWVHRVWTQIRLGINTLLSFQINFLKSHLQPKKIPNEKIPNFSVCLVRMRGRMMVYFFGHSLIFLFMIIQVVSSFFFSFLYCNQ